ncbi:MAG: hypothetical protein SF002_00160 [Alphaproteobacteria bacterium]|nr:hypothetical protein [Alphaproteobacteria bacterium]
MAGARLELGAGWRVSLQGQIRAFALVGLVATAGVPVSAGLPWQQAAAQQMPTVPRARDVVGIALGMTREEARTAVFRHDPSLIVSDVLDSQQQFAALLARVPDTSGPDVPRDTILIRFAAARGNATPQVVGVARTVSFVSSIGVSFTGTYESIERKYGPRSNPVPLDQLRRAGEADLVWVAQTNGRLERDAARVERCRQDGPLIAQDPPRVAPLPDLFDRSCGAGLHIRMTSHPGSVNVVATLSQRLWDPLGLP